MFNPLNHINSHCSLPQYYAIDYWEIQPSFVPTQMLPQHFLNAAVGSKEMQQGCQLNHFPADIWDIV